MSGHNLEGKLRPVRDFNVRAPDFQQPLRNARHLEQYWSREECCRNAKQWGLHVLVGSASIFGLFQRFMLQLCSLVVLVDIHLHSITDALPVYISRTNRQLQAEQISRLLGWCGNQHLCYLHVLLCHLS